VRPHRQPVECALLTITPRPKLGVGALLTITARRSWAPAHFRPSRPAQSWARAHFRPSRAARSWARARYAAICPLSSRQRLQPRWSGTRPRRNGRASSSGGTMVPIRSTPPERATTRRRRNGATRRRPKGRGEAAVDRPGAGAFSTITPRPKLGAGAICGRLPPLIAPAPPTPLVRNAPTTVRTTTTRKVRSDEAQGAKTERAVRSGRCGAGSAGRGASSAGRRRCRTQAVPDAGDAVRGARSAGRRAGHGGRTGPANRRHPSRICVRRSSSRPRSASSSGPSVGTSPSRARTESPCTPIQAS
jgi:hypothetical protein